MKQMSEPTIRPGVPNSYHFEENEIRICHTADTYGEERALETLDHEYLHHILHTLLGREISRKLDSTRLGENLIRFIFRNQTEGDLLGQKVHRYGPGSWIATHNSDSIKARAEAKL